MRLFAALVIILIAAGTGAAGQLRVNNITVDHNNITVGYYNMTWSYTETFTGADSIKYRVNIDRQLGDNNSFVSAWELLKADKDVRRTLRGAIDNETDVKINNESSGIEVLDIDSTLSPEAIGNTSLSDTVVNIYNVTYGFKDSILNASSIWFLGRANTSVTIIMPAGVDVIDISGMNNIIRNTQDHVEVSGSFAQLSKERGEITLTLARNASFQMPEINASNVTSAAPSPVQTGNASDNIPNNATKHMTEALSKVRDASIIIAGLVIILLIYIFKIRRG